MTYDESNAQQTTPCGSNANKQFFCAHDQVAETQTRRLPFELVTVAWRGEPIIGTVLDGNYMRDELSPSSGPTYCTGMQQK